LDSRIRSFCFCQYVQNDLSYSGEETQPKLCLKGCQANSGVSSLRANKDQLLHRIQSVRTFTNLLYYAHTQKPLSPYHTHTQTTHTYVSTNKKPNSFLSISSKKDGHVLNACLFWTLKSCWLSLISFVSLLMSPVERVSLMTPGFVTIRQCGTSDSLDSIQKSVIRYYTLFEY